MRRTLSRIIMGLAWSIPPVTGCGTDFVAPTPSTTSPPVAEPESARAIFLIAAGPPDVDPEGWAIVAQREANRERAIFRCVGPGAKEAPADQPELVRRAIADGASALIVVSSDAPGLPGALAEAESKKIPVVVLGRPVDPPAGSAPFSTVVPRPFGPSADQLVRAALADARKAGGSADGTAVLLVSRDADSFAGDRASALRAAITGAGLKLRELTFDPPGDAVAEASVARTILDIPDAVVVLAVDEAGMQLGSRVRKSLEPTRKVFVAGYESQRNGLLAGIYGSESAFVEYRSEELGRLAVRVALDRLRGQEAGRKVELESRFQRGQLADSRGFRESKAIEIGKEGIQPRPDLRKTSQ